MGRDGTQQPEAAAAVLARCLAGHRDADFCRSLRLFSGWPEAVGPEIARRTRPFALTRGVLWVESEDSTWQTELVLLRPTLVARLNGLLGGAVVRDIKVRCGLPAPVPAPPAPPAVPNEGDREEARALAGAIADPEVRDAFADMVAGQRARARRP